MFVPPDGEPALLVIDPQRAHENRRGPLYCRKTKETLQRINRLVTAFKEHKLPVVYVRHVHQRDGSDLGRMWGSDEEEDSDFPFKKGTQDVEYLDDLKRVRGAPEVTKTRYDAFEDTVLKHTLDEVNANHLVIAGFMTHLCCQLTAQHAHGMDYEVTLVPDATGCPDLSEEWMQERIRDAVGAFLEPTGIRVVSSAGLLKDFESKVLA